MTITNTNTDIDGTTSSTTTTSSGSVGNPLRPTWMTNKSACKWSTTTDDFETEGPFAPDSTTTINTSYGPSQIYRLHRCTVEVRVTNI